MRENDRQVIRLAKKLVAGKPPKLDRSDGDWIERVWKLPGDLRVIHYQDDDKEAWQICTNWLAEDDFDEEFEEDE